VKAKMCNKLTLFVSLSLIFLTLTTCAESQPEPIVEPEIPAVEGPANIRNSAEVYCTGLGYEHITCKVKYDTSGSQPESSAEPEPDILNSTEPDEPIPTIMPVAPDYFLETVCVFPDGNECDDEEFLSGRCGQEYSYCVLQGYTLEPGSTLEPDANSATCIFPDGSSCPEFEFFNGDCGPNS